MKKILKLTFAIIAGLVTFISCETDKSDIVISTVTKPEIISTIPNNLVISAENLDEVFTTVKFKFGTYSTDVPYLNTIEISTSSDFPADATASAGAASSNDSIDLKYKELNAALSALGLEPNTPVTVYIRIKTAVAVSSGSPLSEYLPTYSDAIVFTITPYEPQPAWIYVPGAYQNWDVNTAEALCSLTDNGIYVGYINFPAADSEFKITQERAWDVNWGSADGSTLIPDGTNIKSQGAGYYKITVNLNTLTISATPYSWGLIGDATPDGWNSDADMDWNSTAQQWELSIALTAGGVKFRLNNDWGTNYGGAGLSGNAILGGDNIAISEAGTYFVTLNEVESKYTITKN